MATVNLKKEDRCEFVEEYTRRVFKKRLIEAAKNIPDPEEIAEEVRKQVTDMFPKLNDGEYWVEKTTEEGKAPRTVVHDTYSPYAQIYGKLYKNVSLEPFVVGFTNGLSKLQKVFRGMYSQREYTGGQGAVASMVKTNKVFSDVFIARDYYSRTEPFRAPHSEENYCRGGFQWVVKTKKVQNPETGEITYEYVFDQLLAAVVPKAKQRRAINYSKKICGACSAYDDILMEAAEFASELWKLMQSVRTVKKLQDNWPELWPEFRDITGLDPQMSGKALTTSVNATVLLTEIAKYKKAS